MRSHTALLYGVLCLLGWILATATGCSKSPTADETPETSASPPRAAVSLEILVVDDPELAAGLKLLRGEWAERSSGEFTIQETLTRDLLSADSIQGDLVILPSAILGELVMRDWVRPLRTSVLDGDLLDLGSYLPVVRNGAMRFGAEYYGASLGEMPLGLGVRGEANNLEIGSWDKLASAAALTLAQQESGRRVSDGAWTDVPWAAEFIGRAVSLSKPSERATLFFSPQTFDAKLTSPPLQRAAQMLSKFARNSADAVPSVEVTVPPRGERTTRQFFPLPTSDETYEASLERWEKSSAPPAAVFGFAGRLVAVTQSSRNAASAFQLLPWLVSGSNGERLSQRSRSTVWFRSNQQAQAKKWLAVENTDEASQWVSQAMVAEDPYFLPRVVQLHEYLRLLNDAVAEIALEGADPEGRLVQAEAAWDKLSDQVGRERQVTAYRLHLGLEE